MHEVLRYIEQRTDEQHSNPLINWLSDESVPARDRLMRWLPAAAPWVFGFMDLNGTLLRYPADEAAQDPYKRAINAHLDEDANHWVYYLQDLQRLGLDASLPFTDVLRFLWGEETRSQRMAMYNLTALAASTTDPLLRYCLVLALESLAHLVFETLRGVSEPFSRETGLHLIYIAEEHADLEPGHLTRQVDAAEEEMQAEVLDESTRQEALDVVRRVCDAIADRWIEMFRSGQTDRYLTFLRDAGSRGESPR
jgi:hypothetical protein